MDRLARLDILIDSYGTEFILASRACRGVRLRRLSTNAVTKELLTPLRWSASTQAPGRASDELAETFFGELLARHAHTLYDIAFTAKYENNWSLRSRSVDSATVLHKMESLRVSVNKEDVFEAPNLEVLTQSLSTMIAIGGDWVVGHSSSAGRLVAVLSGESPVACTATSLPAELSPK
ncbi:hypothetical protein B0H19DRAFT_1083881 [Mycena capillaripes]|nr:hypothetical protein B0H19DRAFT_1083881 [Mycena capillaripes]